MSTKKVAFGTKPTNRPVPEMVDLWVDNRAEDHAVDVPMKRLTIGIPRSLHRSIKAQCDMRGR